MDYVNHPSLAGTPPEEGNWNHLGGSFQTPLYRLRPVGVPSRRIPDFLSINDGGVEVRNPAGVAEGLSG